LKEIFFSFNNFFKGNLRLDFVKITMSIITAVVNIMIIASKLILNLLSFELIQALLLGLENQEQT